MLRQNILINRTRKLKVRALLKVIWEKDQTIADLQKEKLNLQKANELLIKDYNRKVENE